MTTELTVAVNGRFLTHPITGVQRYAHEVVSCWGRGDGPDRATRTVLAPAVTAHPADRLGLPAHRIGRLRGHLWEQAELPRHVRADVLFCPANTAPIATLLSRTPVVVTVHDLAYRYFPDAYTAAYRAVYATLVPIIMDRAALVITVSETERASIVHHFPAVRDRIVAIPNGVFDAVGAAAFAGDRPPSPVPAPFVLYVGSLSRRKNLEGFLRAFALLPHDIHAAVVGSTPQVFNQPELTVPEHIRRRIHFAGQLDSTARLLAYYRNARCLVFPSFFESSGLPPLEAMAAGCPVVVSDIPALVERCGDAALYCDPADIESIAAQTRRLLDDSSLRDDLIRRGSARAQAYTWERCADRTWDAVVRVAA